MTKNERIGILEKAVIQLQQELISMQTKIMLLEMRPTLAPQITPWNPKWPEQPLPFTVTCSSDTRGRQ